METSVVKNTHSGIAVTSGIRARQIMGLGTAFAILFALHFGPAIPGLNPE